MVVSRNPLLFLVFFGVGCIPGPHRTAIDTTLPRAETEYEQRQWFLLYGGLPITDPAGEDCQETGIAYAESRLTVWDWAISLGIATGGVLLGSYLCESTDQDLETECVRRFATLAPLIVSSRTVLYQCVAATPSDSAVMELKEHLEEIGE
jgi:hypothetical protein